MAFLLGTLKHIIAEGWVDKEFIREHTTGFDELEKAVTTTSWQSFENASGVSRAVMQEFAKLIHDAEKAIFVWGMGITQHTWGEDNVHAIINLALTKGFVGRSGCGLMPIRGHSGVQGGAEMGAYATAFPGGLPINAENAAKFTERWGFPVPSRPGLVPLATLVKWFPDRRGFITSGGCWVWSRCISYRPGSATADCQRRRAQDTRHSGSGIPDNGGGWRFGYAQPHPRAGDPPVGTLRSSNRSNWTQGNMPSKRLFRPGNGTCYG
jgi:anaerobic selenocysteine-containing dehydrogenase